MKKDDKNAYDAKDVTIMAGDQELFGFSEDDANYRVDNTDKNPMLGPSEYLFDKTIRSLDKDKQLKRMFDFILDYCNGEFALAFDVFDRYVFPDAKKLMSASRDAEHSTVGNDEIATYIRASLSDFILRAFFDYKPDIKYRPLSDNAKGAKLVHKQALQGWKIKGSEQD